METKTDTPATEKPALAPAAGAIIPAATATRQPAQESDEAYISVFQNERSFEAAQRMAKALITSDIVPEAYQGQAKLGNALIALEISQRNRIPVLTVMQNLNIIYGRPSWSAQYVIAALNTCGRFEPLDFEWCGTEGQNDWGCRVVTTVKRTGKVLRGSWITMDMVKSEGWFEKKGSKWKTMPEQMFLYRAASFFGKIHAPEVLNGMQTSEELQDILEIEATRTADRPALLDSSRPALPEGQPKPAASPKPDKGLVKQKKNAPKEQPGELVDDKKTEAPPPPPEKPAAPPPPPPDKTETTAAAAADDDMTETVAPDAAPAKGNYKEVKIAVITTAKKASSDEVVQVLAVTGEFEGKLFLEKVVYDKAGVPKVGDTIWVELDPRQTTPKGKEGDADYKPSITRNFVSKWQPPQI